MTARPRKTNKSLPDAGALDRLLDQMLGMGILQTSPRRSRATEKPYGISEPLKSREDVDAVKQVIMAARQRDRVPEYLTIFLVGIASVYRVNRLLEMTGDDINLMDPKDTLIKVGDEKIRLSRKDYNIVMGHVNSCRSTNISLAKPLTSMRSTNLSKYVAQWCSEAEIRPANPDNHFAAESLRKTHGFLIYRYRPETDIRHLMLKYGFRSPGECYNYLCIPPDARNKLFQASDEFDLI